MAITDKDAEKLLSKFKEVFITKEDAKQFATKDDLQDIRNDLKQHATKNDLKQYATRADLIEFKDDIIKRLDDLRTDKLMLVSRNREHENTINNHEERIKTLEQKVLVS